jgi:uncharacterized protein (UPF0276 family)
MSRPRFSGNETAVGIAYSEYAEELLRHSPGAVDYVEIPFEQLVHAPALLDLKERAPLVLHCASLSLAGNSDLDPELVRQLEHWIAATETPWLGEHIAYVRADGVLREIAEHPALVGAPLESAPGNGGKTSRERKGMAFNVGYTVSPQLSPPVLDRVVEATGRWSDALGLPLLLENGPIYFNMPGSVMSQVEFIRGLCERLDTGGLLLDLSHLAITCSNLGLDPTATLRVLPLDRVVEVHLSGAREDQGIVWDDHASAVPDMVFEMLTDLLAAARPRAVTLEYNWDANFPPARLEKDLERVRDIVDAVPAET